jgi:hypothetical protein
VLGRLLRARGVGPRVVQLLEQLYSGTRARVAVGGELSDWFDMRTGVRQGCPLSPLLFNVFMDFLARLVEQRCAAKGVRGFRFAFRAGAELRPHPTRLDDIVDLLLLLYADDLVLLADSAEALQAALLELEAVAREWGMQLNYAKTKVMVFGARGAPAAPAVQLAQGVVEHASSFSYLGCLVTPNASLGRELDSRLGQAGKVFDSLARIWRAPRGSLTLRTKLHVFNACVMSVLMYGAAETWALRGQAWRRVQAFQATCLRALTGRWRDGADTISNKDLFELTGQVPVDVQIKRRALVWLGHAARAPPDSMLNRLLYVTAPAGMQRRAVMGEPPLTWNRGALALVQQAGLGKEGWLVACQDRAAWRARALGAPAEHMQSSSGGGSQDE